MRNRLILMLLFGALLTACGGSGGDASVLQTPNTPVYTAFGPLELVSIIGYPGHVMEPFFTRDGKFLFFNDDGANKDIYYASYNSLSDTFTYEHVIAAINTPAVEGVPTLDDNNRFYYVSTFNYPPNNAAILDTLYVGDFDPLSVGIVNNLAVVPSLSAGILGYLNFDAEVSPDGSTLYFVDGVFSVNNYPDESNFVYAVDSGSGFVRQSDSSVVFANINTSDLEYAACISTDGLEFFFTRLELATLTTAMYRATRTDQNSAFGVPQKIAGLSGFYEAPTLSPDEKALYFHLRKDGEVKFDLYRMTRR